jgi:ABC-type transporter Mla subunit MlaD
MSFRMRLGAAALVLAVFVACAEGVTPPAASDETARRKASQALDSVDELRTELEAELDDLAGRVDEAGSDDQRFRSRLSRRLDHLAKKLDRALEQMARALQSAEGAGATADSALAQARSVARELAVLDKRLDYHLSNHGGR